MTSNLPCIDPARLRGLLDGINSFGALPDGGFDRRGYSPADMAARRWLAGKMQETGLAVRTDAVGNVIGRYGPAAGPVVLIGSHLDTVPQGGAFDGALGVAVALETILALKSARLAPQTAIEVVATAEEEGRFGGMLGSQALAGAVGPDWIAAARDADGVSLSDAMQKQGLAPDRVASATYPLGSIRAFLELHIEQGPVLEAEGIPVGLVSAISGVCVLQVSLFGSANHSGTTPMQLRADAFAGLAEVAAGIPDLIAVSGTEQSRVTIGKVDLAPNDVHIIPGRAQFSVVLRDTDEAAMERLRSGFCAMLDAAAKRHRLRPAQQVRSWLPPVSLDGALMDLIDAEAEALQLPVHRMLSGAGHDAQTMQAVCPSGLIFVPSKDGVSHAPQEWTDWKDILAAARLFLRVVARLAER